MRSFGSRRDLLVVLVVAAVASPPALAFVADTDASTGNTVEAGVLDLALTEAGPATQESTTDESGADLVTDTWEDTSHTDSDTVNNTLVLENNRSSLAAGVNVTVSYAERDGSLGTAGNADNTSRTVKVVEFVYDGTDLVGTEIADENGNGRVDVEDLTLGETATNLSSLPPIAAGGTANLTIALDGNVALLDGVGSDDGVDIRFDVRAEASSFGDPDRSADNTIVYG